MPALATPTARPSTPRVFGRFELRQLLGKSTGTMTWLAFDPRNAQEVMLTMPRLQPNGAAALERWSRDAKLAARLNHPNLAHAHEVGVQDHWPYIVVDRALGLTWGEWLQQHPKPPPAEVVGWLSQALEGLAFAHEAGVAHQDPQLHTLLINEQGQVRCMAIAVASAAPEAEGASPDRSGMPLDADRLRAQRDAAQRDLLAFGVLLHRLLGAAPVLDEPDVARVMQRMPPLGRELVRLPWSTPHPIPEALRAIANRSTAGQERQRYLNARTLLRALDGWLQAQNNDNGGPLALLIDRLHTVGHLPALPGLALRIGKVLAAEGQRTDEMAEQVLQDMALAFELLRTVNSAQVQGTQVAGSGPVLTIRRSIALIGVDGLRQAAQVLRPWPGPLAEAGAAQLLKLMDRVRLAGFVAQALRPAGYDAEVVYLVTVLQNLGRLMMQYHFTDEAVQIAQLMLPMPPPAGAEPGTPEQPGMTEEAAAYAVLGVDVESLGIGVARHWGLGDELLHMVRRLPLQSPVRTPDQDADMLRITASAANEAVDAGSRVPAAKSAAALLQVAQRYGRVLDLQLSDLQDALQQARSALRSGSSMPEQPSSATGAAHAAGSPG